MWFSRKVPEKDKKTEKIVFATVLISYQPLDGHMVDGREINEINVNPLQKLGGPYHQAKSSGIKFS